MPVDAFLNFEYTTVTVAPSPATSGLTFEVADPTVFPDSAAIAAASGQINVTVWPADEPRPSSANAEIVAVTGIAGSVLTVVRAQEGTAARVIQVGDQVAHTITKRTLDALATPSVGFHHADLCGQGIDIATGGFIDVDGVTTDATMRVLVLSSTSGTPYVDAGLYQPQAGSWVRVADWAAGDTKTVGKDLIVVVAPTGTPLGSVVASLTNIFDGISSNDDGIVGTDHFTFSIMRMGFWEADATTGNVFDAFGSLTISATDGSIFVNAPITTDPVAYPPSDTSFITKGFVSSSSLPKHDPVVAIQLDAYDLSTVGLPIVDGYQTEENDRVLFARGTTGSPYVEAGPYTVHAASAPVRAADWDTGRTITSGVDLLWSLTPGDHFYNILVSPTILDGLEYVASGVVGTDPMFFGFTELSLFAPGYAISPTTNGLVFDGGGNTPVAVGTTVADDGAGNLGFFGQTPAGQQTLDPGTCTTADIANALNALGLSAP